MSRTPDNRLVLAAAANFAVFGAFWGAWGASIPRFRAQAGVDDARLGLALLFVGAGALPATLLVGKAIDRGGLRLAALTTACLGSAGLVIALASHDLVSLSAGLALVGAASGAADVANNTVPGRAEREAGRPVITRAHAVFSTFVVVASLGTGLLAGAGAPLIAPFAVVAGAALVASAVTLRALAAESHPSGPLDSPDRREHATGAGTRAPATIALVGFGLLGALAFASENAHQSWSAVFVTDALGSDASLGSVAPAVFAAAVAITRFATGGIGVAHARTMLATGSAVAAAGSLVVAVAPDLALTAIGLVLAAAGTAVLFPTLLVVMSAGVPETQRGRATSTVTTVSYLGFVLSPVYVGFWSGAVGIRGAMVAVAALGVLLLVLTRRVDPPRNNPPGCPRCGRDTRGEGHDPARPRGADLRCQRDAVRHVRDGRTVPGRRRTGGGGDVVVRRPAP